MTRIFTLLCKKHPELSGERHAHNHACVGCRREQNASRAKRKYQTDEAYRAKVISKVVEHGRNDPEARRERSNKSYAKNRDAYAPAKAARGRVRRHRIIQAQPPWMTTAELAVIYKAARDSGLTVDHIVPLKHPQVCGLHVPWNLELMPLIENITKGSKFDVSAN
jgi:hypothetical protein